MAMKIILFATIWKLKHQLLRKEATKNRRMGEVTSRSVESCVIKHSISRGQSWTCREK